METRYTFPDGLARMVYVKQIDVAELPSAMRKEAQGLEQIFSVHNAEGEQLALVADRSLAFQLARQNDLTPVTVH
ncbi:MAG: DUF1150 family protein [Pseudomonadota bacterium]